MSDTAIPTAPASTVINVDPTAPWAEWSEPTATRGTIRGLQVRSVGEALVIESRNGEGDVSELGLLNGEGLRQLAMHTRFPSDFIGKLAPETRATVINERIHAAGDKEMTFLTDRQAFAHMLPAWRDVIPYRETAQYAHDYLAASGDSVTIHHSSVSGEGMRLRLLLPTTAPITPALNDILRVGIDVNQNYGMTMAANLFTERLVCLNGMTAAHSELKWASREMGTRESQLTWLRQGIDASLIAYAQLVTRARIMAETRFEGDGHQVLRERLTSLRIPRGLHQAIESAFDEEPGDTEWHLVNAVTRVATHSSDISPNRQRDLQLVAGEFTREFDLVEARLPNAVAMRVGARILRHSGEFSE